MSRYGLGTFLRHFFIPGGGPEKVLRYNLAPAFDHSHNVAFGSSHGVGLCRWRSICDCFGTLRAGEPLRFFVIFMLTSDEHVVVDLCVV